MSQFTLSLAAREQLRRIADRSASALAMRRAQALLRLAAGQTYAQVAQQAGVTRPTIYHWVQRYQARRAQSVAERLQPDPHPGRPPRPLALAQRIIAKVWQHDPRRHGFRALVWTVPMLRCEIRQQTGQVVSRRTVRRALRRLRYRYKRPRLVLARRLATWRQAKGG
jgi:transposase